MKLNRKRLKKYAKPLSLYPIKPVKGFAGIYENKS